MCKAGTCTPYHNSETKRLARRRKCNRKSELTLGSPAKWADEYAHTLASPGGTFSAFYQIVGDQLEVAMSAQTTSWVGFGFRASREVAGSGCVSLLLWVSTPFVPFKLFSVLDELPTFMKIWNNSADTALKLLAYAHTII